ncbi:MAG: hypothetical protein QXL67_03025 [Candidatus Bathyarchaeia archaeon]
MVSKDQAIGGIIFVACVVVAFGYFIALVFTPYLPNVDVESFRFLLLAIPVFIALMTVLAIGAWIGWTMLTTPPPKPIEEYKFDEEEVKTEGEERKTTEEKRE